MAISKKTLILFLKQIELLCDFSGTQFLKHDNWWKLCTYILGTRNMNIWCNDRIKVVLLLEPTIRVSSIHYMFLVSFNFPEWWSVFLPNWNSEVGLSSAYLSDSEAFPDSFPLTQLVSSVIQALIQPDFSLVKTPGVYIQLSSSQSILILKFLVKILPLASRINSNIWHDSIFWEWFHLGHLSYGVLCHWCSQWVHQILFF